MFYANQVSALGTDVISTNESLVTYYHIWHGSFFSSQAPTTSLRLFIMIEQLCKRMEPTSAIASSSANLVIDHMPLLISPGN
jgi:hypothetical protein